MEDIIMNKNKEKVCGCIGGIILLSVFGFIIYTIGFIAYSCIGSWYNVITETPRVSYNNESEDAPMDPFYRADIETDNSSNTNSNIDDYDTIDNITFGKHNANTSINETSSFSKRPVEELSNSTSNIPYYYTYYNKSNPYDEGYNNGHSEGYDEGYDEGYEDAKREFENNQINN